MKNLALCFSVSYLPAMLFAQNSQHYQVTGQLTNVNATKVYLIYVNDDRQSVDSAGLDHGHYTFSGDVSEGNPATLLDVSPFGKRPASKEMTTIFLTPGSMSITHIDSFSHCTVSGSSTTADLTQLTLKEKPYQDQQMALVPAYQAAKDDQDEAKLKGIEMTAKKIEKVVADSLYLPFVRNNPNSTLSLYLLRRCAEIDADDTTLATCLDLLSPAIRNSKQGIAFKERLQTAAKTRIGARAPDFTQNDQTGKPVTLSSFKGKYVLLDFWASWCGPCRAENPNLVNNYAQYHKKGFEILGVSLDKPGDRDKWLNAIAADNLNWTQVSDLQFWSNAAARQYGVQSIPQNFLIDPQGKIVAKGLRGSDLTKILAQLFGG